MILLIGCSGSGKSTIEKELVKNGYEKIVSYTTRPKREGEIHGIDYHYINDKYFELLLEEKFFAEHTVYNGWYYGIAKQDCLDNKICVIEPNGYRQLLKIPNLNIKSFYIDVSERERLKRMVDRGDNLLEIFRRIFSDQGLFQFMDKEVNFVVINNDIDKCVQEIISKIEMESV